jgi:hypothetical protein
MIILLFEEMLCAATYLPGTSWIGNSTVPVSMYSFCFMNSWSDFEHELILIAQDKQSITSYYGFWAFAPYLMASMDNMCYVKLGLALLLFIN